MRNISFSKTIPQMKARTKTHTIRNNWLFLIEGDVVMAVEKAQGLKKGEKIVPLYPIRIISVNRQPLNLITPEIVLREGFPDWTTEQFIDFYCKGMGGTPETIRTFIKFEEVA